jgi:spermidine synthase
MTLERHPRLAEFATIGLISASMLMHQILLTRVCALRLQFHFAFLVISNCLLGLGAAGTLLTVQQARFHARPRLWLGRFTLAYTAALIVTYLLLLATPLPRDIQLNRLDHVLELTAFNLVGAVPFFFSGLVIGLLLSVHATHVDRLYAVDLLCASIGCIACPLLLPSLGAGGVFVVGAMLAVAASMCAVRDEIAKPVMIGGGVLLAAGLAIAPNLDHWLPVPSKPLETEARIKASEHVHSTWTANSRIDFTLNEGCVAPIFMRGSKNTVPWPRECREITQDATAATTIIDFTGEPAARETLVQSMYSAAYRLKQHPKVLIIGLGGGNDAWAAKINGASSIKAIELNWPIVEIHKHWLHDFSRDLVDDPNVTFVVDEGRSALMRESQHYDVIQMTGIDTWTALASGAYVLAENYLYTREAIRSMWEHLEPDGILQISRFAQVMEELRLLSNIYAALHDLGVTDVEHSLILQSTPDHMVAVQVKKGKFTLEEEQRAAAFADQIGLTIDYLPSRPIKSWVDAFIRSDQKQELIDTFPRNISPTEDDQPYFFNFTRWQHPIDSIKHIDEIPVISQGNPFFLLTQLIVSILLSVVLIVFPLVRRSELPKAGTGRILVFFCALGVGYISIEIAVIQRLTLLLGQPVYSLTVTLFSLLLFTGLGSMQLARRVRPNSPAALLVPLLIAGYIAVINLGSPLLVSKLIASALPIRILASVLLLLPLGLLLGIPFAYGLRVTHEHEPRLTAWAWAVNGCLSVVGSILCVVISMNFGFSAVLWTAAAVYLIGFASLHSLRTARTS